MRHAKYSAAFIVPEGAMQTAGREKTSVALPSTGLCVLQYQPARQGEVIGALGA